MSLSICFGSLVSPQSGELRRLEIQLSGRTAACMHRSLGWIPSTMHLQVFKGSKHIYHFHRENIFNYCRAKTKQRKNIYNTSK